MGKSASNDRRARLAKKQERESKEGDGGNYRVLDTSEYPDVKFIKPELDTDYLVDVMPYIVTSKKHPKYSILKEEGFMEDDRLDLYVHTRVGPSNKNMVCPNKNYGKPCPVCEEHDRLKEDEDLEWDDKKLYALRPKRKSFYNVVDLEDNNTMKIFEYSYGWFTKNLKAEIKRKSKKREYLLGDISEDGFSIGWEFTKSKYNGKEYCGEVKSFDFENMENTYTDEDIEDAPKLDTMIKLSTYDEIYDAFHGNTDDDGSDKDGGDNKDEDAKEERSTRRNRKDKDEEVDEKSSRRSRSKKEEELEPEYEPPVNEDANKRRRDRKRNTPSTPVCPIDGLEFGKDIDTGDCACDEDNKCEFYDACDKVFEEDNK